MGVADGVDACGRRAVVLVFAAFTVSRAREFVRTDLAENQMPVTVVGSRAGLCGGYLGPTHHCLEDLAAMRLLPNMTVLAEGADAVAFAHGPEILEALLSARATLADELDLRVVNVHTLEPVEAGMLAEFVPAEARFVVTVEEHWPIGGLGDLVRDHLTRARLPHLRLSVPARLLSVPETHAELARQVGPDAAGLAKAINFFHLTNE